MQQCTADKIIMSYHKLCKNMICMPSLKKIKSQVTIWIYWWILGSSSTGLHRGCLRSGSPCSDPSPALWRAFRQRTYRVCNAPSHHHQTGLRWKNLGGDSCWPSQFRSGWCCFPIRRKIIRFIYTHKKGQNKNNKLTGIWARIEGGKIKSGPK